jgi:carboxyl-terminal processing protease
MARKASLFLFGAVIGAATMFVARHPSRLILASARAAQTDTYRELILFGNVFELVRTHYVEKPDADQLIASAINGMLSGLDPHTSYIDAKGLRDMLGSTRGEFGGLGLDIASDGGLIQVIALIDDTPAAKAGVRAGDVITHIDDETVEGLPLSQVMEKIRGPVGSKVRLGIMRNGSDAPIDMTITRDTIRVQSVRMKIEGNDIGYIRIMQFNEQTTDGLSHAITEVSNRIPGDKLRGYVLDLRNNPGGLLDQAISISSDFLERGEIVSTRGRDPGGTRRYSVRHGDLTSGKPLIVLLNGGSASASECVAGALQDHRRATLIGTRSYGKGTVQSLIPLGAGKGALRLTTARYFTPSGRSIQAKGISPDIEVLQDEPEGTTLRALETRGESSLPGHLKAEGDERSGSQSYIPPDEKDDKALALALDLLRGTKSNPAFPPNPKSAHLN